MRKYLQLAAIVAIPALNASPAMADDLSPGLWEITMETRVPGAEGFAPPPTKITQCLTADDARDPSKLVGSLATPGATGCGYTEKSYAGGNFHFVMDCSGSYGLKAKGDVSFTANSISGVITATGNVAGTATETQSTLSARRLGGC